MSAANNELHGEQYNRVVVMRRKLTVLIGEMQREGGVSLAAEIENLQAAAHGLDLVLDEMDDDLADDA